MSRPVWSGSISFGLVNIPVLLYSGEKKFDIQFKLLDSRDKSRIRYLRVNEHTGEEVPWKDIAKGYEYDENNYVILKEKDLKEISGEHSKTITIDNFISAKNLSSILFNKPYYLVPDKKGDKGYVILRELLAETKKIAIAKVIIHTREYLAAVMPYENALILNLLHYPQEIRSPTEFELPTGNLAKYKISAKEMTIAKQLLESMTTQWKPKAYHDEYRDALEQWIEKKIHHKGAKKAAKSHSAAPPSNVINFVDLLKKSLNKKKVAKVQRKRKQSK